MAERCLVPGHGLPLDEVSVDGMRVVEVTHGAALCLQAHAHDRATIVVMLDGGASERSGLDVVSPRHFEPLFRRASRPHANQYHAIGARSLLVEIAPDHPRVGGVIDGGAPDRSEARALAARLLAVFGGTRTGRTAAVRATVRALLAAFAAPRPSTPSWLDAAREAYAAQYVTPPTVEQLAERAGVHPVYFAQAFRARWGMTTRAFVRAHRVFDAVQLVAAGASLASAAVAAGFADQSHMTRAIRADRGAPPGALMARRTTRP